MNTQEVKKEDCIGHVQKRLGTALRSYKKKRCGAVLPDGKGTGSEDVLYLLADRSLGRPEGSLFISFYQLVGEGATPFPCVSTI